MAKSKSKPPKPPGQYDVGYGRPPVQSRFPPDQSGNPAGRRKGQPTPNEIFMKEAARLVKIKRGDTVETITKHEAIIRRLLQSELEGDIAAARLVLLGLTQNAPDPSGGPAEDETANLALSATPDDETLRRMLARFAHLQPKEEEAEP
jgi:Family of unknown function (DUF5681)